MQESIDVIVKMSNFPISIIIVGIGNGNFEKMIELDSDDKVLISSKGTKGVRDIVQFAKFNKKLVSESEFVADCLKEIPRQVTSFYKLKKITPNDLKDEYQTDVFINRPSPYRYMDVE